MLLTLYWVCFNLNIFWEIRIRYTFWFTLFPEAQDRNKTNQNKTFYSERNRIEVQRQPKETVWIWDQDKAVIRKIISKSLTFFQVHNIWLECSSSKCIWAPAVRERWKLWLGFKTITLVLRTWVDLAFLNTLLN